MFTGLIQTTGIVTNLQPSDAGVRLTINAPQWAHRPETGDSIAVSGCCLTVAELGTDQSMMFDVIPETLRRTTLGSLANGDIVNLEHAATPTTLLGGHIVQGHVDSIATVSAITTTEGEHRVTCTMDESCFDGILEKGSITLNGVSLTVAACDEPTCTVALIPETLARTNLSNLEVGTQVNVEIDYLARLVGHWLSRHRN